MKKKKKMGFDHTKEGETRIETGFDHFGDCFNVTLKGRVLNFGAISPFATCIDFFRPVQVCRCVLVRVELERPKGIRAMEVAECKENDDCVSRTRRSPQIRSTFSICRAEPHDEFRDSVNRSQPTTQQRTNRAVSRRLFFIVLIIIRFFFFFFFIISLLSLPLSPPLSSLFLLIHSFFTEKRPARYDLLFKPSTIALLRFA